ncbi:MAG: hypothetical protein H0W76_21490 [Pyrinomonadaceae bacterium]|nr:hypothetical protein [Pyrinomonadaceae bacterium]
MRTRTSRRFIKLRWCCICNLVLFIFFLNLQANATTYYVNSRFGNDDNTGATKEAAWKSLKNLSRKFLPGDNVLFARGSSYTGGFVFTSSGTATKPIVFSSYSVEADVILKTPRKELAPIFEKYGAGPAPSFTNPVLLRLLQTLTGMY